MTKVASKAALTMFFKIKSPLWGGFTHTPSRGIACAVLSSNGY